MIMNIRSFLLPNRNKIFFLSLFGGYFVLMPFVAMLSFNVIGFFDDASFGNWAYVFMAPFALIGLFSGPSLYFPVTLLHNRMIPNDTLISAKLIFAYLALLFFIYLLGCMVMTPAIQKQR